MTGTAPVSLFNSMNRALQVFEPLHEKIVRIYTCGPTVYNYAHLGNLRAYVFADTLRRTLQWKGFDIVHIINITDVGHLTSDADEGEDKVEIAARRANRSAYDITRYYTDAFFADLDRLNVRPAAMYPRATEHIQEMISFVQELSDKGLTYALPDGLYFDTSRVSDYGALGALSLESQKHGARVEAHAEKLQPWDFCLWRLSPTDTKRQMEWESPWGKGFPGWHLECSAMSLKYLSDPFDIHTGGIDHRQLHHCNEIAQNQGYLDSESSGVNYWLHCEFLVMREEKMSKSTGNFWRLQTLVDKGVHPLVYRFFLLQAHYRSQLEFSMDGLIAARTGYQRILRRVQDLLERTGEEGRLVAVLADQAASTTGGPFDYLRRICEENLDAAAGGALPATADRLAPAAAEPLVAIFETHSILIAPTQFSATAPLKLAAPQHGFRAATMPGFGAAMIPALRLDYREIDRRVRVLKELLDAAAGAVIRFTVDGEAMRLDLDLRHRIAHASGGLLRTPGTAGNLPSGEAYIVPYEGEHCGDPSRSRGLLPVELGGEVVRYRIAENRAVEVVSEGPESRRQAEMLALEPAYGNLAELGFGVLADFGVRPIGVILLDEKLGLHIAFGRSDHFGGQVGAARFSSPAAVVHIDRVYLPETQPQVGVEAVDLVSEDGGTRPLMREHRFVLWDRIAVGDDSAPGRET